MGPLCQKHLSCSGNFPLDYLAAVTSATQKERVLPCYTAERGSQVISCFYVTHFGNDKDCVCSIRRKINLALGHFWRIPPTSLQSASAPPLTSHTTNRISQNALCLLGQKGVQRKEGGDGWKQTRWQRCRRSIWRVIVLYFRGKQALSYIYICTNI